MRAKVSDINYPGSGKPYVGLTQLIKGFLSEKVLEHLGYKVDEKTIEEEAKRIDKNTKAPEILQKIKDLYRGNREGYMKTFVRIVYSERYLYNEVFLNSPDVHREQRTKAEELLKKAKDNPERFKTISFKIGLEPSELKLSRKEGITEVTPKNKWHEKEIDNKSIELADFIIKKIEGLRYGQVFPEIIEWMEGYQIIRFLKRVDDDYYIESVSIQKRNYDDWFWSIAGRIPVKIYDKKLKDEFLREVSWAKNINIQNNIAQ